MTIEILVVLDKPHWKLKMGTLFAIILVTIFKAILGWQVLKWEQPKGLQNFWKYLLRMHRGATYDEINTIASQLLILFFPFSYVTLTNERSKSLVLVVGLLSIINLMLLLILTLHKAGLWL